MQFAKQVLTWHNQYGRHDLPWQKTNDPYLIWVSEIMLQQTQVKTVIGYYQNFSIHFPTISSLAQADLDMVLSQWSGLGYYSRARNLHRSAQLIVAEHNSKVPNSYADLLALPGIGCSTASAILAQAYELPYAILDGNVKRLLSRHFGYTECVDTHAGKLALQNLADQLMPKTNCRQYTQAIMDMGALICLKQPQCGQCPLSETCLAKKNDQIAQIPVRKTKKKPIEQQLNFHVYKNTHGEYALIKRGPGIWHGLYCFPEATTQNKATQVIKQSHILTHRRLQINYHIEDSAPAEFDAWLNGSNLLASGIPQAIRKMLPEIETATSQKKESL